MFEYLQWLVRVRLELMMMLASSEEAHSLRSSPACKHRISCVPNGALGEAWHRRCLAIALMVEVIVTRFDRANI